MLLSIVKSSSRSKEAADALRAALLCLSNISRSRWGHTYWNRTAALYVQKRLPRRNHVQAGACTIKKRAACWSMFALQAAR